MNRTHLETVGGRVTPEYRALHLMKARCYNERNKKFPWYGARGIRVCERWLKGADGKSGVECFIDDMGRRPSPLHSVDRIDNDGNYEPGNCRWATQKQQQRNTSRNRILEIRGVRMTVVDAAEMFGLRYGLVGTRLWLGWDDESAVGLKPKTLSGKTNST